MLQSQFSQTRMTFIQPVKPDSHIRPMLVLLRCQRVNLHFSSCKIPSKITVKIVIVSIRPEQSLIMLVSLLLAILCLCRKRFHGCFHCNSARPGGKPVFCQHVLDFRLRQTSARRVGGKRSATPLFIRPRRVEIRQRIVRSKAPSPLRSAGAVQDAPCSFPPCQAICRESQVTIR